jgi:hypothetical protein
VSKFDDFTRAVLDGVPRIATGELKGLVRSAKADAQAFLDSAKEKLERRTEMLARGDLLKEDFEDLVKGQADLAVLFALTQAGVAAARLQRFRKALIDLVIKSAFKTFLP